MDFVKNIQAPKATTEQSNPSVLSIDHFKIDVDKAKLHYNQTDEQALDTVIDYYKSK